ncbi:hypothetical protein HY090_01400 [Candidatus Kaiserbacteria bacterium]|nr:hypothetical protein [Candidatus Kaiserbacteria bacterium]
MKKRAERGDLPSTRNSEGSGLLGSFSRADRIFPEAQYEPLATPAPNFESTNLPKEKTQRFAKFKSEERYERRGKPGEYYPGPDDDQDYYYLSLRGKIMKGLAGVYYSVAGLGSFGLAALCGFLAASGGPVAGLGVLPFAAGGIMLCKEAFLRFRAAVRGKYKQTEELPELGPRNF